MQEKPDHLEVLFRIISRFDFYFGTMNAKAALVAAFNSFALGTILLRWNDLVALFEGYPNAEKAAAILLVVSAVASIVSLAAVFASINPYLKSRQTPGTYHSSFYFRHVAEHESAEAYLDAFCKLEPADIVHDLASQAHVLSRGLRSKFRMMNIAVLVLIFGELGAGTVILLMKLWIEVFP